MQRPGRKQTIISAAFFVVSLYMVYLTYYYQLRSAWQPTPASAAYIFSMIILAVLPTVAYMFNARPRDALMSSCVLLSFLMSFVGTFVFFVFLYVIYVMDLSLVFGKEFFGNRAVASPER